MIQVEIISATECKTVNPLVRPDRNKTLGLKWISLLHKWEKSESDRKVFRIDKIVIYSAKEYGIPEDIICPYDHVLGELKIGSIHSAELNEETNTAIII